MDGQLFPVNLQYAISMFLINKYHTYSILKVSSRILLTGKSTGFRSTRHKADTKNPIKDEIRNPVVNCRLLELTQMLLVFIISHILEYQQFRENHGIRIEKKDGMDELRAADTI